MITVITPLDRLAVHQMAGSKWWLTLYDYELFLRIGERLHQITIPAGFRYDRSSIPWEGFITKDSLGCIAPAIHDALYRAEGRLYGSGRLAILLVGQGTSVDPWRAFTRAEADEIFRAVMLADGVKPWRAALAYYAVRIFGGKF